MIPIRDDIPMRIAPVVVLALIAANVLVFAYELSLSVDGGVGKLGEFVDRWGLVPREFLRGIAESEATRQIVWVTPLSAMFIHGGLLHLAGNLLYLWIFGAKVEGVLGPARFAVLYLACGLAAAVAQIAGDPESYTATVGASGAISGILGAYAVSFPTRRLRLLWPPVRVPALIFLLVWVLIQLLAGLEAWPGDEDLVAWWAHVGGFAAGVALGRTMWVRKPTRSRLRI